MESHSLSVLKEAVIHEKMCYSQMVNKIAYSTGSLTKEELVYPTVVLAKWMTRKNLHSFDVFK